MDFLELVLKVILGILAIFGGKEVVDRVVIKFNKRESHVSIAVASNEAVSGDKVVINNYNNYHFPGIGNSEDLLSQKPVNVSEKTDFIDPPKLTEEQEDLGRRLDLWHQRYGLTTQTNACLVGYFSILVRNGVLNPDSVRTV